MTEPARGVVYVSCEHVEVIHDWVIARYGGRSGLLNRASLESSVAQPKVAFFGIRRHKTIAHKAAAYCYFITRNHPFADGNKRTGFVAALHFLRLNGKIGEFDDDEIVDAIRSVAMGSMTLDELKTVFQRSVT